MELEPWNQGDTTPNWCVRVEEALQTLEDGNQDGFEVEDQIYRAQRNIRKGIEWVERGDERNDQDSDGTRWTGTTTEAHVESRAVHASKLLQKMAQRIMSMAKPEGKRDDRKRNNARGTMELLEPICWCMAMLHHRLPPQVKTALAGVSGAEQGIAGVVVEQWLYEDWEWELFFEKLDVCLRLGLSPIQAQAAAMKLRNLLENLSKLDVDCVTRYACQHGAVLVNLCQLCRDVEFASREIMCNLFLALASPARFMDCVHLMTFSLNAGSVPVERFFVEVEQLCVGCEYEAQSTCQRKILLLLLTFLVNSKLSLAKNFAICNILQVQKVSVLKDVFEEIAAADLEVLRKLSFSLRVYIDEHRRFGLLPVAQCIEEVVCGSRHGVVGFLNRLVFSAVSDDELALVSHNLADCLLRDVGTSAGQLAYNQCAMVTFQLTESKQKHLMKALVDPCKGWQEATNTLVNLCMFHIGTGGKASAFAVKLLCRLLEQGLGTACGMGTTITELFVPAMQQDAKTRLATYQHLSSLLQGTVTIDPVTYTGIEDVLMQQLLSYSCLHSSESTSSILCPSLCFRLHKKRLKLIEPLPLFLQCLLRTRRRGSRKRNRLARKTLSILQQLSNPLVLSKILGMQEGCKNPHPEAWLPAAYVVLPLLELLLNELALYSSSAGFSVEAMLEILSMHMVLSGESSTAHAELLPESKVLELNPVDNMSHYLSLDASLRILHECILAAKTVPEYQGGGTRKPVPPDLLAYTVALAAGKVKADKSATDVHLLKGIANKAIQLFILYSFDLHKPVDELESHRTIGSSACQIQHQEFVSASYLASLMRGSDDRQAPTCAKSKPDDNLLRGVENQNNDDALGEAGYNATSRLCVASLRLYSYIFHRLLDQGPGAIENVVDIAMAEEERKNAVKAAVKYAQPSAGKSVWNSAVQVASSCPLEGTRLSFTLSLRNAVVDLASKNDPDKVVLATELCRIVETLTPLAEREIGQLSLRLVDRKTPLVSRVPIVLLKLMWECPVSSPALLKSLLRGLFRSEEGHSIEQAVHQEAVGAVAKYAVHSLYSCFGVARGKALQIPDSYECGAIAFSEILSYLNQMLSSLQTQPEILSEACTAQSRKFAQVCSPFRWICLVVSGVESPLPADLVKATICFKDSSHQFLLLLLLCVKWVTGVQGQLLALAVQEKGRTSASSTLLAESSEVENPLDRQRWKPLVKALAACERLVSAIRFMIESDGFASWPSHRALPELRFEVEQFRLNRAKLFAWSEECGRRQLARNKQMQSDGPASSECSPVTCSMGDPFQLLADMLYNAMLEAEQADLQEYELVEVGGMDGGDPASQQPGEHSGKRRTKKAVVKSKGKKRQTRSKRKRSLNPYIDAVMAVPEYGSEDEEDDYRDLEDFIVCKPGKDYRRVMYKYSTAHDLSD